MRNSTARRLSTAHTFVYRATRGAIGRRLVSNDMLLLTTTGHATGRLHTVPLLYLRDGYDLVVIASWGGRDVNPTWYDNLVATPQAMVQIRGDLCNVVGDTANPDRRAALWPRIVAAYDGYADYQSRTTREIPIVILTLV